jgi:hypothetical protein
MACLPDPPPELLPTDVPEQESPAMTLTALDVTVRDPSPAIIEASSHISCTGDYSSHHLSMGNMDDATKTALAAIISARVLQKTALYAREDAEGDITRLDKSETQESIRPIGEGSFWNVYGLERIKLTEEDGEEEGVVAVAPQLSASDSPIRRLTRLDSSKSANFRRWLEIRGSSRRNRFAGGSNTSVISQSPQEVHTFACKCDTTEQQQTQERKQERRASLWDEQHVQKQIHDRKYMEFHASHSSGNCKYALKKLKAKYACVEDASQFT